MLRVLPFLIGAASILLGPFFAMFLSAQWAMAGVTLMSNYDDLRGAKVLTIDDARLNEFQNGRLRSSDPNDWTRITSYLASGMEHRPRSENAVAAAFIINGFLWLAFGIAFSRRAPAPPSGISQ